MDSDANEASPRQPNRKSKTEMSKPLKVETDFGSHPRSKSVSDSPSSQSPVMLMRSQTDDTRKDREKHRSKRAPKPLRAPNAPPESKRAKRQQKGKSTSSPTLVVREETDEIPTTDDRVVLGYLAFIFHEAKDLPAMDLTGKSDPYIKVFFEGINNPKHKWTTSVARQTLSPVWEQGDYVPVHKVPVVIKIECWDKDFFSKDDFIGTIEIQHNEMKDVLVEHKWIELKPALNSRDSADPIISDFKDRDERKDKTKEKDENEDEPLNNSNQPTKLGKINLSYQIKFGQSTKLDILPARKRTFADQIFSLAGIPRHKKSDIYNSGTSPDDVLPEQTLFDLIATNDIDGVQYFLTHEATPEMINSLDEFGNSALHVACLDSEKIDPRILELLLAFRGINVSVRNHSENTPLHYLCYKWPGPDLKLFNLMYNLGANVNALNTSKETPLFKAIQNTCFRKPIMEWLLEHKAKPDLLNSHDEGILHYAARLGRADLVNLVLRYSKDTRKKGAEGLTPKQIAIMMADASKSQHIKDQCLTIVHALDAAQDLEDFLEENRLGDYREYFMEEELDLETLCMMKDEELDRLQLKVGPKQKLITALRALKKRHQDENFRIKQRLARQSINGFQSAKNQQDYELKICEIREIMSQLREESYSEISIVTRHQLEYLDELGNGASSSVWKGFLRYDKNTTAEVAIKIFFDVDNDLIANFRKEFSVLARVEHPNVVKLLGVALEPQLALVMEYCARGSLYHSLSDETIYFTWPLFFQVVQETLEGLIALHSFNPPILHRDLKSLNILLTADWHVRVADFGFSADTTASSDALKSIGGSTGYIDPLIAANQVKFSSKSDIYSLGIVLWEILHRVVTGRYLRPFEEYDFSKGPLAAATVLFMSAEGKRPTIPGKVPLCLAEIVLQCYSGDISVRPEATEVYSLLKICKRKYNSNKVTWDLLLSAPPAQKAQKEKTQEQGSEDEG